MVDKKISDMTPDEYDTYLEKLNADSDAAGDAPLERDIIMDPSLINRGVRPRNYPDGLDDDESAE